MCRETRQRGHTSGLRQKTARRTRTRQRDKTTRSRDKMARKHDGTMQQDEAVRQWDLDSQRSYSVPQRIAVSSDSRAGVLEQGNDQRQQDKTKLSRSRTR